MKVNENQFFREITLRICGSLDIEKALWNCYLYITNVLPADELILTVYDPGAGTLDVVATANKNGGMARSDKVPMPPDLQKQLGEPSKFPRVRTSDDVYKDTIVGLVAERYLWPDSSIIVGRLIVEGRFVGSFIVRADGKNKYGEEHEKLWSLINEPAAVALANSLRYQELMKLKELLADDSHYFQNELRRGFSEEIVGAEFGLKAVMEQVFKVAPLSSPVLLEGETGTGKELIANAIHNFSPRNNEPLIKVNCGAIPDSLIDSELFGHEKGAFTGATSQQRGRFERAHRGTIFLDEVCELPHHAQVRLLRVLQEKEIERVGGAQPVKVDLRIISATNKDLRQLVEEKKFRDDLYYRLCVVPIRIPPLRERKVDIPALVDYFMRRKAKEIGLHFMPRLVSGTIERLVEYDWPGNVRELSNAVERAIVIHRGEPLGFEDIVGIKPAKDGAGSYCGPDANDLSMRNIEVQHIMRAMEMAGGNVEGPQGAAAILRLNPGTLRSRMRKLGIPFGRKAKALYSGTKDPSPIEEDEKHK
ncbi:MAG TPA: sigma 54-interacting transcriptional regulator [Syntrophorhabdaceae bacterium]|nr:sigma 54-interacting transcriptional regulator [Syntrophorhabdaceae bacterium]HQM79985.1 sigma 54-interacting transcriptional regulator [Syntrophorhabdaceae bacterium]